MLSAKNITKRFSGITALDNVSLDLEAGQVRAIIGENGAGKSTLMKILSGVYTDYEGVIELDNQSVQFKNTRAAQDKGIAIIHQELNLIPELNVVENLFLGREITTRLGILDTQKMYEITEVLLHKLKLKIPPSVKIKDLKVGQQQLVEIAKALLLDVRVIIMDEPTSAITGAEVETLFTIIADLKKEGKAIAYISHKLDELFQIADTFTVLRDGKVVDSGSMNGVTKDSLVSKMVGRELGLRVEDRGMRNIQSNSVLLRVENLEIAKHNSILNPQSSISFSLKKGEILGIFGLMGAGRTELFEKLFGLNGETKIEVENTPLSIKSPSDAVKAGLALVPEDRKKDGIIPELSVRKNISLTTLSELLTNGFLNSKKEKDLADKYISDLKIKTATDVQLIKNLSGGNQQKAILGKWLATNPKILLLDEPTRGIDINAKTEIYRLIKDLAASGLGILMVSSELLEILAVSDRVLVLSEGKLTGDFGIDEATEAILLKAAIFK